MLQIISIVRNFIKNRIIEMYVLISLCILLIVVIKPFSTDYFCKNIYLLPNFPLLIIGLVTVFILLVGKKVRVNVFQGIKQSSCLLKFIFGILFIQGVICYNIQFLTNWDVDALLNNAKWIADGKYDNLNNLYFSNYPNNILLLSIFSLIYKFLNLIGIDSFVKGVRFLVLVQCILSVGTLCLLYRLVLDITKSYFIAFLNGGIYFVFIGLSPWLVITYTDSMGLIFPILILFAYHKCNDKNVLMSTFVICLLTYFGYKIKPQVAFVSIAIIVIETLFLNFNFQMSNYLNKQIKVICTCIFAIVLCNFIYSSYVVPSTHLKLNRDAEFGVAHYLMLGHDYTRGGVYSGRDVQFSREIPNRELRTKENIRVFCERVKFLGFAGLTEFYIKKTLTNFNDGTFAWGHEGNFYSTIFKNKNEHLSPFLRNIFYNNGKYFIYWSSFMQMIWLTILFFNGCIIFAKEFAEKNKTLLVAIVSIIGLIIFETLFEARARYLYTYVPIYILLATIGCKYFIKRLAYLFK